MQIHRDAFLVKRNWGHFLQFATNENCTIKLLKIEKGKSISYQYHNYRSESWFLISGKCWFISGQVRGLLLPGETVNIAKLENHKLEGLEDSIILEISRGIFDEEDIIHL